MSSASAALTLVLSVAAATLPTVASWGYGYHYGPSYYGGYGYGKNSVFLNKPELILPPGIAPSEAMPFGTPSAESPTSSTPATAGPPSCSVYMKATSTGSGTGHLTLTVSDTSNANFEAPYTLMFANPSLIAVNSYNTNNSPATVTLGENGVVTSVVTSVIPALNSNTLDYNLTSSAPDANFNPNNAFTPNWVSVNGIPCGIVVGF